MILHIIITSKLYLQEQINQSMILQKIITSKLYLQDQINQSMILQKIFNSIPLLHFRQEANFKISFHDNILKFKLRDDVNCHFSCKEVHMAEKD